MNHNFIKLGQFDILYELQLEVAHEWGRVRLRQSSTHITLIMDRINIGNKGRGS